MNLPENWIPLLKCRSIADKIAIPRDCELCPVDDLPAIFEMVRDGVVVWIDRTMFQARISTHGQPPNQTTPFTHFQCDVYQLTTKGIALCREHGIEQT